MIAFGFMQIDSEHCMLGRGDVWILLYVDDAILIFSYTDDICNTKRDLMKRFEMKDLGELC